MGLQPEGNDGNRHTTVRQFPKTHRTDWKAKLRQNCLRRVREERAHLLWKIRVNGQEKLDKEAIVQSAFRGIVSDELLKIKQSPLRNCRRISTSEEEDVLWEYDGLDAASSTEAESEDLLIEMERLLYEELREEIIMKELEVFEEEDEYLARAVFEHMQLGDDQVEKSEKVWCPVCKQGDLGEACHLIYCTRCNLRLDLENDKVNLNFLRDRLGEVHMEHLERGCKATPSFSMESLFDLTALYIKCLSCNTFEIVI